MYLGKIANIKCLLKPHFHDQVYPKMTNGKLSNT